MESKNVIAAIALSTAVIVLYSLFFIPEQSTTKQNLAEKNKIEQNKAKKDGLEIGSEIAHFAKIGPYFQKLQARNLLKSKNIFLSLMQFLHYQMEKLLIHHFYQLVMK